MMEYHGCVSVCGGVEAEPSRAEAESVGDVDDYGGGCGISGGGTRRRKSQQAVVAAAAAAAGLSG